MSSLLKALVESSGEFAFGDAHDVELKGLAGLHQLHQVSWAVVNDAGPMAFASHVAVLREEPVNSPEAAVRAAIVQEQQ